MADYQAERFKMAKQEIHAIIAQLGHNIPPKAILLIEETLAKAEQVPLSEAMGFTPELIEGIYQHGYHLFQSGKYSDALLIFNFLTQFKPDDTRFLFAIAAAHHYNKNYLQAAANYMVYAALDPQNPIPYFHLYDCFIKAGHSMIAQNVLEEALRLAKMNPKYDQLKEKIQLELQQFRA